MSTSDRDVGRLQHVGDCSNPYRTLYCERMQCRFLRCISVVLERGLHNSAMLLFCYVIVLLYFSYFFSELAP